MSVTSDDEDNLMGDMFPEPPRPATPPPTTASYTFPPSHDLPPLTINLIGSHHSLWGHVLFESSLVMSNHLAAHQTRLVREKNVLEFGAGAGVPGLAAGVLGAKRVVLTDYPSPELLQNLEGNVKRNAEVHSGLEGRVVVQGHVWGKGFEDVLDRLVGGGSVTTTLSPPSPATSTSTTTTPSSSQASNPAQPPNPNKFQTLLLSDLIFNHSQHIPLLRSLEALIDPPSGVALVFHSHHLPQHRARDLRFFTLAEKRGWTVDNVVEEVRGVQFEKDGGDVSLRERVWGREMRWDGVVREETSDDEDDEDDV